MQEAQQGQEARIGKRPHNKEQAAPRRINRQAAEPWRARGSRRQSKSKWLEEEKRKMRKEIPVLQEWRSNAGRGDEEFDNGAVESSVRVGSWCRWMDLKLPKDRQSTME